MTDDEKDLITKIALEFNIDSKEARQALLRLERLGLIAFKSGRVQPCHFTVVVPDGTVPSSATRDFHKQILKKADHALETQSVDKRYSNSIVLPVLHDDRDSIHKDILNFQKRMLQKYGRNSQKDGDEVYALSLQFFSLQEKKDERT